MSVSLKSLQFATFLDSASLLHVKVIGFVLLYMNNI